MALVFLIFCYFGQAYGCARTSSVSTATLAPGVTTTLPETTAGTTTTVAGQTTTTTETTTTTTENLALTCKADDVTLMVEMGFPGSVPTAGPVVVMNMDNTMTITCVAMATANTQITYNDGALIQPPSAMSTQTLVCNSMGKWTFGSDVIMNAACNDA